MDKKALRALAAKRRGAAQAENPYGGSALVARFPGALFPPAGTVVSGYWPIQSEIDPLPLMRALSARGCALALPVTPPRGSDLPLSFRLWTEADVLVRGAFDVHEPAPDAPMAEPILLLVPLLAFDRLGGRLGYGAGHYDRTLAGLRTRGPIKAVGLAYAVQEVPRVPMDAHDAPLDGIVTETAYIEAMRTNS